MVEITKEQIARRVSGMIAEYLNQQRVKYTKIYMEKGYRGRGLEDAVERSIYQDFKALIREIKRVL